MRPRILWTIFRKELTETLRDRRTLFMMVVLPVLLYPMMIIGFSWFEATRSEEREQRASVVAVWGEPGTAVSGELDRHGKIAMRRWEGAPGEIRVGLEQGRLTTPALPARGETPPARDQSARARRDWPVEPENPVLAAARRAITSRSVDAVLVFWPDFDRAIGDGGLGRVTIYFDSVRLDSSTAMDRLTEAVNAGRKRLLAARERDRGLSDGFTRAIDLQPRNVAVESRRTGQILGSVLPFILVVVSLLGGFYPAIDLTAGEKERGTMQTLMCAPLRPAEVIVGKFAAVWVMALVAALVNVASLAATLARLVPGQQLTVPISVYLLTFAMLMPITVITSATFLAVAAFAKDFKDGQNFLTPVYMVLSMPAAITMLPGVELSAGTAFLPVVNIALLIKALLVGEAPAELAFLVLVSSLVYAALAVLLAAHVFQQEQVLLGGRQSPRELLGLERRRGGVPGANMAVVSFAALLVLVFYGSLLLQGRDIATTVLTVEYLFFLAPTLAVVVGLGFSARDTLSLRLPPLRGLIAGALVGVSAWAVVAGLLIRLMPPPESLVRALTKILLLEGRSAPLWALWAVVAITPAICEELYFRGFVLSGLRRWGPTAAILVSAVFFGLAHASIYRMLPTAFLGVILGWMVWRTGSILPGIIAHAINNGLAATVASSQPLLDRLGGAESPYLPWRWTAVGAAVLVVAIALVRSLPERSGQDRVNREATRAPAGPS